MKKLLISCFAILLCSINTADALFSSKIKYPRNWGREDVKNNIRFIKISLSVKQGVCAAREFSETSRGGELVRHFKKNRLVDFKQISFRGGQHFFDSWCKDQCECMVKIEIGPHDASAYHTYCEGPLKENFDILISEKHGQLSCRVRGRPGRPPLRGGGGRRAAR